MKTERLMAYLALSVVLVIVTIGVTILVSNHLNRKILLPIAKDCLSGQLGQDTNTLYSYKMGVTILSGWDYFVKNKTFLIGN